MIKLYNTETKLIEEKTLDQILENINRDRSEYWENYDSTDWIEGLNEFTEYEIINKEK